MGGNALKNTYTRRYNLDEFKAIEQEVIESIRGVFPHLRCIGIPAYADKKTFGDLDLLIEYDNSIDYNRILDLFSPKEIYKNGGVWSFDYKEFQIDLILTSPETFNFSYTYFSFNDLGNLIGRIAHKIGLKYGQHGLNYVVRNDNYIIDTIEVSKDIRKTFELLDYDYDRYLMGFKTIEEVFEYTTTSKYYSKDIFEFKNRNHRSRVRDAKRANYIGFLAYIGADTDLPPEGTVGDFAYRGKKEQYIKCITKKFPDFQNKLDIVLETARKLTVFKSKYDGVLVKSITGLEKKELGDYMKQYKTDQFFNWIISDNISHAEIRDKLVQDWETQNNT